MQPGFQPFWQLAWLAGTGQAPSVVQESGHAGKSVWGPDVQPAGPAKPKKNLSPPQATECCIGHLGSARPSRRTRSPIRKRGIRAAWCIPTILWDRGIGLFSAPQSSPEEESRRPDPPAPLAWNPCTTAPRSSAFLLYYDDGCCVTPHSATPSRNLSHTAQLGSPSPLP